jgi:membrane protein
MVQKVSKYTKLVTKVIILSFHRFAKDQHAQRAVALTYHTLFAIVPLMALFFAIAKGFNLEQKFRTYLLNCFSQHKELLERIYHFADTALKESSSGVVAGVGVIALIWTVMGLATNVEKSFNSIWGLPNRSNIIRRLSDYIAAVLITPVALIIMGSAGIVLRQFVDKLEAISPSFASGSFLFLEIALKLAPTFIACCIFTFIYFAVPNTKVKLNSAIFAGVISGILYQLLQDGFILLQTYIFRYNNVYGSFAILPLFLILIQCSWQITLLGSEFSFVFQNVNTGLFDDHGEISLSYRRRRARQLTIAKIIYANFDAGFGAVSWTTLEQQLSISAVQLDSQLDELLDAGIICKTGDAGPMPDYLPALPPDKLTIQDAINLLECRGINDIPKEGFSKESTSLQILEEFAKITKNSSSNTLLKNLK